MSKMHLSPSSSQTQTLPDVDSVFSPRNELLQLLQREQDEAMALLDSSPFLTGLVMKYTMGAMSRTSYDYLCKELEKSKEGYDFVVEEAERIRAERDKLSQELELLRKESEAQLEKALQEKEQMSKECKELRDLLAETRDELHMVHSEIANTKVEHEASITKIRAERQEVEQRATKELEKCHAEISELKMRDKIFLDVITHQRVSATDIETPSPIDAIPSTPHVSVSPIFSQIPVNSRSDSESPPPVTEEIASLPHVGMTAARVFEKGKKKRNNAASIEIKSSPVDEWSSWGNRAHKSQDITS